MTGTGEVVKAPVLEKISPISEGVFAGKEGKNWNFYNLKGEKLSGDYAAVGQYTEGLAPVEKNKLWGYVDKEGNTVVPYLYKAASSFSEGLAAVKKNKYWGYIDTKGREQGL